MSLHTTRFGTLDDGTDILLFTLSDTNGVAVSVTNYGGIVAGIEAPDRKGDPADVVLGFDTLDEYVKRNDPYFGALCGRCANRIDKGRFTLDGVEVVLSANQAPNHLHGGNRGFDKAVWAAEASDRAVTLTYRSADGEEGYPGNLDCRVVYTLTDDRALRIAYRAETDKPTIVNLTNHSYFNLTGSVVPHILDHILTIRASRYTLLNDEMIPTGEIASVAGTPFDFRAPKRIGRDIDAAGYDYNSVLDAGRSGAPAARAVEPSSGRVLELFTTEPGVQFYTGNFLDGRRGKRGAVYNPRSGFCLEAQHFPDAVHHPAFPSVVVRPGEVYTQTTSYRFSVE